MHKLSAKTVGLYKVWFETCHLFLLKISLLWLYRVHEQISKFPFTKSKLEINRNVQKFPLLLFNYNYSIRRRNKQRKRRKTKNSLPNQDLHIPLQINQSTRKFSTCHIHPPTLSYPRHQIPRAHSSPAYLQMQLQSRTKKKTIHLSPAASHLPSQCISNWRGERKETKQFTNKPTHQNLPPQQLHQHSLPPFQPRGLPTSLTRRGTNHLTSFTSSLNELMYDLQEPRFDIKSMRRWRTLPSGSPFRWKNPFFANPLFHSFRSFPPSFYWIQVWFWSVVPLLGPLFR